MILNATGLLVLTLLLVGGQTLARPLDDASPPGRLISVGSFRLHIHCTGRGTPTVVLDSGLGGTSLNWALVQPRIAPFARVCAYDRAGYGWSDPGPGPRTSERLARELHRLLATAGLPGPFLLVGHSLGGINVRLFAHLFPTDTAGVVLVDASSGGQLKRFTRQLPDTGRPRQLVILSPPRVPKGMPPALAELATRLVATPAARRAIAGEISSMRTSLRQADAAPIPEGVPLVVVSRGRRVWPLTPGGDRLESAWDELQSDLAARHYPAVHIIAARSGHQIPLEQPEAVLNAVRTALEMSRATSSSLGVAAAIWPNTVEHCEEISCTVPLPVNEPAGPRP
ncbi:MAG TPA: alpha/beta hydrolase [Gammaproteobacteria bacterium]|nr:alpha/beta hydrolase [Gammaproteobacteria bacterium]